MEILHIVAFSKKTGYLHVTGSLGKGAIVFEDGMVVCSYSWSTLKYLRQIGTGRYSDEQKITLIREQIDVSLRDLARLREGPFYFELKEGANPEALEIDISTFILQDGINPQHLLLDLTKEMDEDRRDTTAQLESLFTGDQPGVEAYEEPSVTAPTYEPSPPEPVPDASVDRETEPPVKPVTVVLVDDESLVVELVGNAIEAHGYNVVTADRPAEGAVAARELALTGEPVVVVVDLKMPTSSGKSFFGGFELVRRLNHSGPRLPVLLMAESLSETARKRALELGIQKAVFKPTLTKLDPVAYESDLRAFASTILHQLSEMMPATTTEQTVPQDVPVEAGGPAEAVNSDNGTHQLEYLASMTEHLVSQNRSMDVSRMVLQVAAKYVERGILFMIKADEAGGLAAFGVGSDDRESSVLARKLRIHVSQIQPFADVTINGGAHRLVSDLDSLEECLYSHIGRGRASGCVLLPMVFNREALLVLYGDNGLSGRPLDNLRGLELFIAQAGMALENALLQQKLQGLDTKLSIGQG